MSRRRYYAYFAILILCLLMGEDTGCDDREVTAVLQEVGVANTPPPPAERVDFVCDLSLGRPCNDDAPRRSLGALVGCLWPRVDSRVVVWGQGDGVSDALPITTADVRVRPLKTGRPDLEAVRTG